MHQILSLLAWAQQNGITYVNISPDEPDHNIAWVILSTFALIGISVVIVAALGIGMGFVRILFYKYLPGNKLNGPEYEPMTRLGLHDRSPKDTAASSQ